MFDLGDPIVQSQRLQQDLGCILNGAIAQILVDESESREAVATG